MEWDGGRGETGEHYTERRPQTINLWNPGNSRSLNKSTLTGAHRTTALHWPPINQNRSHGCLGRGLRKHYVPLRRKQAEILAIPSLVQRPAFPSVTFHLHHQQKPDSVKRHSCLFVVKPCVSLPERNNNATT
ncbi:hypothetical protein E2C01_046023 [Portunus trituberculatus]|uniref:Uncharacterized protein n=1 Tax=Portunus trituberculatus TaxID=210409 RepID=A0A5B7FXB4_PORTR|nr:hypothetical protein [Portunus trituberculatus]